MEVHTINGIELVNNRNPHSRFVDEAYLGLHSYQVEVTDEKRNVLLFQEYVSGQHWLTRSDEEIALIEIKPPSRK